MQIIKSNLIIDNNYKPSLDQDYFTFFQRAMVFAQTNYGKELARINEVNFIELSPIIFFEEYCWEICLINSNDEEVSSYIYNLLDIISPLCHAFLDDNFIGKIDVNEDLLKLLQNEEKVLAINTTWKIILNGIRLFGWDDYKKHFLSSPQNLSILSSMNQEKAERLSDCICGSKYFGGPRLRNLAKHWGFQDPLSVCESIKKLVNMKVQVIGAILLYAFITFIENKSPMLYK